MYQNNAPEKNVYWYCHRQQFLATVAGHKIGRYSTSVLYVQWDWMKDGKASFVRPPKNRKELKSKKKQYCSTTFTQHNCYFYSHHYYDNLVNNDQLVSHTDGVTGSTDSSVDLAFTKDWS